MVQLQVLSGRQAGSRMVARRFPFRIGRAGSNDLVVEEPGVWDRHVEITLRPPDGFVLAAQPNALVTVNSRPVSETILRNGDLIGLGGAGIRFALAASPPRNFAFREWATWGGLAALFAAQLALIGWLLSS